MIRFTHRTTYKSKKYESLNDENKFKQLVSDPTKLREGQLQRCLQKLNNKGYFDESVYDYVYPVDSLPSRLYDTPKIHKIKKKSDIPPLGLIVLSNTRYNYNLASYLRELLTPFIPSVNCRKDSFTFIKNIQEVSTQDSFTRLVNWHLLFSAKEKVPYGLKSYVIYKFLCAGCNASCVGKTYRHISTRTRKHLETDKSSNIYRHVLKNPQCKPICDENCFLILDSARTKYTFKLKEGMYIKWLKPSLNKQVKCILPWILV